MTKRPPPRHHTTPPTNTTVEEDPGQQKSEYFAGIVNSLKQTRRAHCKLGNSYATPNRRTSAPQRPRAASTPHRAREARAREKREDLLSSHHTQRRRTKQENILPPQQHPRSPQPRPPKTRKEEDTPFSPNQTQRAPPTAGRTRNQHSKTTLLLLHTPTRSARPRRPPIKRDAISLIRAWGGWVLSLLTFISGVGNDEF